jgi:riboflavin kinase/FMN adenylyltransferase
MNRPVLTIGTFDGVHKGHRYLLKKAMIEAHKLITDSVVITYPRHPLETINSDIHPYLLTESNKRERLIKQSGISKVLYLNFDKAMSEMKAEDFLSNVLIKEYNPQLIVVGHDTHFGFHRYGNADLLKDKAHTHNYKLLEVKPVTIDNKIISSTLIRELISAGSVDTAFNYLGYYYSVIGSVVVGKKLGRVIGFPTINIKPDEPNKLIPKGGVYFTCTKVGDKCYYSATNIGTSPTVKNEGKIGIETYLFDFAQRVYEQEVEVFFIEKIREEQKFDSMRDLSNQIQNDTNLIKTKIKKFNNLKIIEEF